MHPSLEMLKTLSFRWVALAPAVSNLCHRLAQLEEHVVLYSSPWKKDDFPEIFIETHSL